MFTGLNGVRGLAALMVVLSHSSNRGLKLLPGVGFQGAGKMGVWLFFILSSFLLSKQIIDASKDNFNLSRKFWTKYLIARVFRILPLYFLVTLFAYFSTQMEFLPDQGLPAIVEKADLVEAFTLQKGRGIFWTIPVEFKFYFILPILIWVLIWVNRVSKFAPLITLSILIPLWFAFSPERLTGSSPLEFLGVFLCGTWCAFFNEAFSSHGNKAFLKVINYLAIIALLYLLLMLPSVYKIVFKDPEGLFTYRHWSGISLGWVVIVLCCVMSPKSLASRVFSNKILTFVGALSYSLYLLHYLIIKPLVFMEMQTNIAAWLALAGSIIISFLSYRCIEIPFMNIGRKLKNKYC